MRAREFPFQTQILCVDWSFDSITQHLSCISHASRENTTTYRMLGLRKKNFFFLFDSVNWIVILNTTLKFPLNLLNIGSWESRKKNALIYAKCATVTSMEKHLNEADIAQFWNHFTTAAFIWMAFFFSKMLIQCKSNKCVCLWKNNVSIPCLNSF